MNDPTQFDADVETALRGGTPDDAARLIMTHNQFSLPDARKENATNPAKPTR